MWKVALIRRKPPFLYSGCNSDSRDLSIAGFIKGIFYCSSWPGVGQLKAPRFMHSVTWGSGPGRRQGSAAAVWPAEQAAAPAGRLPGPWPHQVWPMSLH